MKYYIETYGCQMNFAESISLENSFNDSGFDKSESPEDADFIILNTCSIRKSAEERVWGRIGDLKQVKKNKNLILVLTGCIADHFGLEIKKKYPDLDLIISNYDKANIPKILKNIELYKFESALENGKNFIWTKNYYNKGNFKAFVPIMHGCSNFCTYCIVPYVRGPEISRSYNEIIEEVKFLESQGVLEITLLGQNVNSYKYGEIDFPILLEQICMQTKIRWIRFVSSHPKDVSNKLIDVMASYKQICPSLLLPVQHGSDKILDAMNRKYDTSFYLNLVKKFRDKIPEISLSTDILVGFPNETEDDLNKTLNLLDIIQFDEAFTYYYNNREGTVASKMEGQLSEKIKKSRLTKIIDKQLKISALQRKKHIGKIQEVLVESKSKKDKTELFGRSIHNNMVVFAGADDLIGKIVKVKIEKVKGNTLIGAFYE